MIDTKSLDIWLADIPFKNQSEIIEEIYLKAIINCYEQIDKSKELENKIRDRFYWHLINHNPITKDLLDREVLEIGFESWKMISETEKRRVDLYFKFLTFRKFEIECKLLFQQPSKNEAYLNDGLIRFINLKYSEKNEYAGMIGFVVSGKISTIKDKILQEVKVFNPNKTPIQELKLNWEHSFISHHKKINDDKIQIYHLFFQFTDNE